jgi:hypothetical protein
MINEKQINTSVIFFLKYYILIFFREGEGGLVIVSCDRSVMLQSWIGMGGCWTSFVVKGEGI